MFSLVLGSTLALAAGPQTAEFDVRHELVVTLPENEFRQVRTWLVLPRRTDAQRMRDLHIEANVPHRVTEDPATGNRYIYVEQGPQQGGQIEIVAKFRLQRDEVRTDVEGKSAEPLTEDERKRLEQYLATEGTVVVNDEIRELAAEITGGQQDPLVAARRIYDWVLVNVNYWVKDPDRWEASDVGSTEYCLATGTGNCTDFHALNISLLRGAGIPARMIYGSFFKLDLDGVDQDQSYHCWIEFYVPGIGWIPSDVAVADIYAGGFEVTERNERLIQLTTPDGYRGPQRSLVDYYFSNIEERRVDWNLGREVTLVPAQDAGPVTSMPRAYVEVDGKAYTNWTRKLTYREQGR